MATKRAAEKGSVGSAVGPAPAPRKGVRPSMDGVPGELISLEGLNLVFGHRLRISPYDVLLDQLAASTDKAVEEKQPRPGLKFGDVRAKASVYTRAKKKGLLVSFAEVGRVLYVRLDGRADDHAKETRRGSIRKLLANGVALTHVAIAARLREAGDASVDAQLVDAILAQMLKAGDVIRQDGGAWKLNPARKAG